MNAFAWGLTGFGVGATVGVLVSGKVLGEVGKIAQAVRGFEATVHARLVAIETAIKAKA